VLFTQAACLADHPDWARSNRITHGLTPPEPKRPDQYPLKKALLPEASVRDGIARFCDSTAWSFMQATRLLRREEPNAP